MKAVLFIVQFCIVTVTVSAQELKSRLSVAFGLFQNDPQMKAGIASLYVQELSTGTVVFAQNEHIGLAPASTQKVITAATAFALLGKDFRYRTAFGILKDSKNNYHLFLQPSGDPTFGSWRWTHTDTDSMLSRMSRAILKAGIKSLGSIMIEKGKESENTIPDGWIWQDIGNYYGAGAGAFIWRENQYDLVLRSGSNLGSPVTVVETNPTLYGYRFVSRAKSAAKGSGDNAYLYFSTQPRTVELEGTIPVDSNRFTISGAMPDPGFQFSNTLKDKLRTSGLRWDSMGPAVAAPGERMQLGVFVSPTLDSIIQPFMKRSINLYGEALVKTFARQKNGEGTTAAGIALMKQFWKGQGIETSYLNMVDGSGLSPLNRVSTAAQVAVLRFAKSQTWYAAYLASFPEYNGMKMKSGTISGAKGFCGYHRSASGKEYVFSFLVNNFEGSATAIVQKMYKVLDLLK